MELTQYKEEIAAWRQLLDESLRRENGWLALAGLFWLNEGDNAFGSDPENAVVVPGDVAAHLGVFRLTAATVTLHTTLAADVRINGEKVEEATLIPDTSQRPTLVTVGSVTMVVKQLEGSYAIRLWDNGRPERHAFTGRHWYPIQESYRLTATFKPYETPEVVTLTRSVGADFESHPIGYVNFILGGQDLCFIALQEGSSGLFLPFRDATNGQKTYQAGRYLRAEVPQNGRVTLDFNKAYHPPCFFTPYATCTLPPRQNWLDIAIEAGEHKPT